jgi:hypothetical protein
MDNLRTAPLAGLLYVYRKEKKISGLQNIVTYKRRWTSLQYFKRIATMLNAGKIFRTLILKAIVLSDILSSACVGYKTIFESTSAIKKEVGSAKAYFLEIDLNMDMSMTMNLKMNVDVKGDVDFTWARTWTRTWTLKEIIEVGEIRP